MHSDIYPTCLVLLTVTLLNGNVKSDKFYEDKPQISNQKSFSIQVVLNKSTCVN